MHGKNVFLWQQKIENGEHGLLHFTGITHAGNQYFALGKIDHHRAVAIGAIALGITLKRWRIDDLPHFFVMWVVVVWGDEE